MSCCGLVSLKNGEFEEVEVLYDHYGSRSLRYAPVVQDRLPLFTQLPRRVVFSETGLPALGVLRNPYPPGRIA
jgi:hypothetical protein